MIRTINRREVGKGAAAFAGGLAATLGLGAAWTIANDAPRIDLLGCGSSISVLVSAGGARVLLLNGSNPADFSNTIARTMQPGTSRIDLLIVPGHSAPISLAARAHRVLDPRMTLAISDATELLFAQLPVQDVLKRPRQFQLPDGVTIEIGEIAGADDGNNAPWSARIQRNNASLLVLSDADAATTLGHQASAAIVAQLSGKPAESVLRSQLAAIVLPSTSMSGPDARSWIEVAGASTTRLLRLHGGDHLRFGLTSTGLSLPQ